MKTDATERPPEKNRSHILETLATILVVVILVGGMVLLFQLRQPHQSSLTGSHGMSFATQTPAATAQTPASAAQTPAATASGTPQAPTSVMLSVSASGLAPTTRSEITIPSGTTVTLTVLPDHSLLPFQTFTMGIYATDPYGFSELQYCTYPKTDTCSYTIAYSSSEQTDYTKGKHTFKAFLGNIGGAIEENSAGITITWS